MIANPRPASIWSDSGWPEYYETHRKTTAEVYPSEWFFLKDVLGDGISVLDIGCAVGGLASILSEHVKDFSYTGVDISEEMIRRAQTKHPTHRFHVSADGDLSILGDASFDLVVCFGVLHLTRSWRDLLASAWGRTKRSFLFDLREGNESSIEDATISYFRVDHLLSTGKQAASVLPYNVVNAAEARATVIRQCSGAKSLKQFGYLGVASSAAITPVDNVFMTTYRVDR